MELGALGRDRVTRGAVAFLLMFQFAQILLSIDFRNDG